MHSYIIVLKDGKIITIRADDIQWCKIDQTLKLYNGINMVARVNMNNIVGWVGEDYMVKKVVLK